MRLNPDELSIIEPHRCLPGREAPTPIDQPHFVNQRPLLPPFPEGTETIIFAMGCFWGAERLFWRRPGVYVTAVGYAAGTTPNPSYEEVCSGRTGHTETVLVAYRPEEIALGQLLATFWEGHNPTQGMRQGNDIGTQYRSGVYLASENSLKFAEESRVAYQKALSQRARGEITTEILPQPAFYYAEQYHQQYLAINPGGYCGLGGCGVEFPD